MFIKLKIDKILTSEIFFPFEIAVVLFVLKTKTSSQKLDNVDTNLSEE